MTRGKVTYERNAAVGDWAVTYGILGYVRDWGQIINMSESGDFLIQYYDDNDKNKVNEYRHPQAWDKDFVDVFATKDEAYDCFLEAYKEAEREGIRGNLD